MSFKNIHTLLETACKKDANKDTCIRVERALQEARAIHKKIVPTLSINMKIDSDTTALVTQFCSIIAGITSIGEKEKWTVMQLNNVYNTLEDII